MSKIKLSNVRLSFPSIFKRSEFNGEQGKFEATFLLNKETQADQIRMLEDRVQKMLAEAKMKVSPDKICMKDGDFIDYDGYAGHVSIKASTNRRPTVIDRDKTPLVEDDNKPYAGAFVNAIIDFWLQDNSYGKRVNANLFGVQFFKDGEAFGSGDVDVTDDFDDYDDI